MNKYYKISINRHNKMEIKYSKTGKKEEKIIQRGGDQ
jgi:predicted DNA-binding WGR domain protein